MTADGTRLDVVVDGPVGPALGAAAGHATLLRVAPVGDELEDLFFSDSRSSRPPGTEVTT